MQKLEKTTIEAVRYLLENYKTSKSQIARALGITPQAVNNYLNNKSNASLTVADKFKEIWDITITDVKYFDRAFTKEEFKSKQL